MSATVDITDAFADAVRVAAYTIRPGDYVFDASGGRHIVKSVTRRPCASDYCHGRFTVTRADGWAAAWHAGESVTIVRGPGFFPRMWAAWHVRGKGYR